MSPDPTWSEFDIRIFYLGWAAFIVEQVHRFIYRDERKSEEWFDIGGESG